MESWSNRTKLSSLNLSFPCFYSNIKSVEIVGAECSIIDMPNRRLFREKGGSRDGGGGVRRPEGADIARAQYGMSGDNKTCHFSESLLLIAR